MTAPLIPNTLAKYLAARSERGELRRLRAAVGTIDLCSNDYLGISTLGRLTNALGAEVSRSSTHKFYGSTGSRLVSGNNPQIEALEDYIARFHNSAAALLFSSGYAANIGLMSALLDRRSTIIYDAHSHASIIDGVRLGFGRAFSFRHNDLDDLQTKLSRARGDCFIAVESVYSTDGSVAPLRELAQVVGKVGAYLIVDEVHAIGVYGETGSGMVAELGLEDSVFARVLGYGKAFGAEGAAVIGSSVLRDFLINTARSFIYTTAPSYEKIRAIRMAYDLVASSSAERAALRSHIELWRSLFPNSTCSGPIQAILTPGADAATRLAARMRSSGFNVQALVAPTVARGSERLRVTLHSFNTYEEILAFSEALGTFDERTTAGV